MVVGCGYAVIATSGNSLITTVALPLRLCASHPLLSVTRVRIYVPASLAFSV